MICPAVPKVVRPFILILPLTISNGLVTPFKSSCLASVPVPVGKVKVLLLFSVEFALTSV